MQFLFFAGGGELKLRRAIAALGVVGAVLGWAAPALAEEVVRIAVATGVPRVAISGEKLSMAPLVEGASPAVLPGGRAELTLDAKGKGVVCVNGEALEGAGAVFTAAGPLRAGEGAASVLEGEVEVRVDASGLVVIHVLPLEAYVAAVVGSEMPPSFPPEALKSQAVAARTFAVFKKLEALEEGRAWHLGATVLDQVYRGSKVDPRARAAAEATAGEVLIYDHGPIEAYFHANCGGRTERGADALGRDLPYLAAVPCRYCHGAPRSRWTVRVAAAELGRVVGLRGPARALRVVSRSASGRAARVQVEGAGSKVALTAVELRQRLGYDRLPSLAFEVSWAGGQAVFEGRGSGHGAGLCQWGAAGAARAGEDYRTILARYYPGTEIVRMY